jgi:stage V sporulation protein AF
MDDRNGMQEGEWQPPVVPPVPPQGPGESGERPVGRKLIRPERDEPANWRSGKDARESERSKRGHFRQQSRRSRMPARGKDVQARERNRERHGGAAHVQDGEQHGQVRAWNQDQEPPGQVQAQHGEVRAQSQSEQGQAHAQSHSQHGQAHAQSQGRRGQSESEQKQPMPASLDELKPMLEQEAGLNTSFDVVLREMTFGGRRTALFYMNGLVNSAALTEVLKRLSYLTAEDIDSDALKLFFETYVPAIQVTKSETFDDVLDGVLAGNAAMFVDRERAALIIDAKMFPDRTPEEPSLERVVRGSRDGFVETLMTNVSLIRRRLRDKDLRYELIRVGARTKTDVCIAYIRDIADPELVEEVKRKIGQVNVYGLPLADKQLEETTVNLGWHPFPLVRYSERPDVVAAQLLEGSVAVLTDTTPSVMMLPTTYFDLTQHAEENRQTPFIGTYLRWVRYIGILFSLFLLPLWFLLVLKPELKPPELDFLGPQQMGRIPLFLQFVLAEIGVDLMRMAAVHTPSPLSTAMSLIAAILIGDIAVKTGLFNNEVILYMAVAAIGMFATPNYELGLANRIVRLALIIAVAAFGVPGLVVGTALFIVVLACTRSFNRPYLWPFIPFDGRSLAALLVRPPELKNKKRNPLLKPQQLDRLPDSRENRQ